MGAVKTVTDASFTGVVLESKNVILVDCWAEWCGPCRKLAPILDEIAAEHDEIEVFKLNIDENPHMTQVLGIKGVPTLFVFKSGDLVKVVVGAKTKAALLKDLSGFLR